jgi:hypothetical protein
MVSLRIIQIASRVSEERDSSILEDNQFRLQRVHDGGFPGQIHAPLYYIIATAARTLAAATT